MTAREPGVRDVDAYWQGIGNGLALSSHDVEQLRTDFYRGDARNDPRWPIVTWVIACK